MRVLIVDDERNVRHILRTVLEALGHNLGEAYSSTENGGWPTTSPLTLSSSAYVSVTSRRSICSRHCDRPSRDSQGPP
jgi:CheY-like chemotaxis protein